MSVVNQALEPQTGSSQFLRRLRAFRPSGFSIIICTLICGWFVFVPLSALFYTAFTEDTGFGPGGFSLDNFKQAYASWHIFRLFWNSLVFASGTAVVTLFMGGFVAWAVERTDAPGREIFHSFALLAFAIPGLITTMAWMLTLSPNIGWVNTLLKPMLGGQVAFNIYSMTGMVWALSSHYFPLAYLLMGPAMRMLDMRMEEAAAMSGARWWQTLTRVSLPMLRPAILSTLLLLFIRGIESFEVPRLIGKPARIEVFTTDIQMATSGSRPEFGAASALSMTLLAICIIAVYFYRRYTHDAAAFATVTGKGYKPMPVALGAWRWPVAVLVCLMFTVSLGLPLLTLVWQSFFKTIATPFMPTASPFSFANYEFVLHYPIFVNAVKSSVMLGAMAATIVVLITAVTAWIVQRSGSRFGWVLDALVFSPIAIPSIIIGASVLFAYLMLPFGLYGTIWILLVAYITLYLPFGMRFASGGLTQIHKELEEAAAMSGANAFQVFTRILLPLLAPVFISAWLYIFVLAVRELSASVFLIGPGTQVLGTISLTMWEEGSSYGAVCALGVIQIIPLLVIVTLLRWLERRMSGASDNDSKPA